MALIVAARFNTFDDAQIAANQLLDCGIATDDLFTFFVNPAANHGRPIDGVDKQSQGGLPGSLASAALVGLIGACVGAAIGMAFGSTIIGILAGAGVGAYVGSLAGAMRMLGRQRKRLRRAIVQAPEERPSGVVLAVHVEAKDELRIARILRDAGGHEVERAQGRWEGGTWRDFDPEAAQNVDIEKEI